MRFSLRTLSVGLFAVGVMILTQRTESYADAPVKFTPSQIAFYEKDVLPILKANCYQCHGNGKLKGGLDLRRRDSILTGGDLGPAAKLDKPLESHIIQAINYTEGLEMPPKGKLPPEQIVILTKWVKDGLPFPEQKIEPKVEAPKHKGGVVTAESRNYWAYKKVVRPDAPKVKDTSWVKNPIDAFILSKLEEKGLKPAPEADKLTLVRRIYFDLTGLPPTPEQIDTFMKDSSPKALEALIDRLLESKEYGEKWGRHWLDLVRFAETNGYERDGPKPFAWRYRDYVIQSFNQDKPFDQFIREQLAGDELPGNDPNAIIATGYYRMGLWDDEPVDLLQARFDELDDIVATTSQVFLGMTMNCARCHDHKIDPIPQKDYYSLVAFFADVPRYSDTRDVQSRFNLTDITPMERRAVYEAELRERQKRIDDLTKQMTTLENTIIKKMPAEDQRASEGLDRPKVIREQLRKFATPDEWKDYVKLRDEHNGLKNRPVPSQEFALSVNNCNPRPKQMNVCIRGNPHSPGAPVNPAFPEVLGFSEPKIADAAPNAKTSGRRTVLANWIASKENQLTSRVFVNRVWQNHFGRGIVPTTNDFGLFGEKPTHPELLDWLATEFMNNGWKLKAFHKLIMTSNTYRMSSKADPKGMELDPSNTLLWRFNMRRLTAEEVRDSILAVSGKLNLKPFGPSVYPLLPRAVLAGQSVPGQGWGKSSPEEASRRSVYVYIKRSLLVPILIQHDQADTDSSCPVRYTTTVPTQALGMLNGEFTNEQALFLAERLRKDVPDNLEEQVRLAIRLTTGRQPKADEVTKDVAFIREVMAKDKLDELKALKLYCLLALNANEFVYLD